jgi:hypothetical protein
MTAHLDDKSACHSSALGYGDHRPTERVSRYPAKRRRQYVKPTVSVRPAFSADVSKRAWYVDGRAR